MTERREREMILPVDDIDQGNRIASAMRRVIGERVANTPAASLFEDMGENEQTSLADQLTDAIIAAINGELDESGLQQWFAQLAPTGRQFDRLISLVLEQLREEREHKMAFVVAELVTNFHEA